MQRRGERGVRPDSLTNQLRALAKHKPRKRLQLEPLSAPSINSHGANDNTTMDAASLQKQAQSPLRLQWLVDDLVQAAGAGDLEKIDQYIRGGVPVDRNHSVLHYSALHAAAALDKDAVTKVLVQAGADANATTQDGESPLHMAARYGKPAVVHEILRHGVDMKSPNHWGFTPLAIAADRQDHALVQLLEPPPDAPTDIHAQAVSSTSLTVAWHSSVSASSPSAYLFKVTWVLCESAGEMTDECSTAFYRIANLLPASQYTVRVQAGNHTVGWSAHSLPVTFTTDGDVPSAMVAPTIVEVSDSSIRMRLQLPQSNGSEVTRVSVQSQCTGAIAAATTSSFRRLLKAQDRERAWESIVSDVNLLRHCGVVDTSTSAQGDAPVDSVVADAPNGLLSSSYKEFVATGLTPGCVYYFRVKAMNASGWSPDGEVSDGICTNDCPKVVRTTARSMLLVWTKPYSTEHIDCYELHARVSTSTRWDVLASRIPGQSLDVSGLVPATAYSFRIVPHYAASDRWGDAQKATCSPLASTAAAPPEPPVDFQVLDRTAHSIAVTWRVPRCNGHIVESYALQLCKVDRFEGESPGVAAAGDRCASEWTDVNRAIPVACCEPFVVESLEPGRAYRFRVQARNALGDGAFLVYDHVVWTYPFVAPLAPVCIARTSFSLHLEWHASDDTGGAALAYDVHMRSVESLASAAEELQSSHSSSSSGTWSVAAQSLRESAVVVSGLRPLGCYVFRICAYRAADSAKTKRIALARADSSTPLDQQQQEQQVTSVLSAVSEPFQTLRRI